MHWGIGGGRGSGMNDYIVVKDRAVPSSHDVNSAHLKRLATQGSDGAAEDIVNFALEFGGGLGSAFIGGEHLGVQTVGAGLARRIFGDDLHVRTGKNVRLGLIMKPPSGGQEHEDDDGDDHQIVGPTAALVG